jgi:glycosyltransferase involved in cell wall biosynthesis
VKPLYINGRFLAHRITGVERYGRELLQELDLLVGTLASDLRVEVLVPREVKRYPNYQYLKIRQVGKLSGHAWEQLELPIHSLDGILFTPAGLAPLLHPRNIITIHDVAVFAAPAGYSFPFRIWYKTLYFILSHTALHILTDSNFSKKEIVRWCRADPEKITVAYLGGEHVRSLIADNSILEKHDLRKDGYILAVSSRNPNKNFKGIILALDFLKLQDIEVVIAGKQIGRAFQHDSLNFSRVKELGYVTDEQLRALYENAACFVFPSFYEGFGLPPIEALLLGCPTVVANAASLPEICGEVALLCDPNDPKDIADKIIAAVHLGADPDNRRKYPEFAARYTFKKCARLTWTVLSAAMR